MEVKGEKFLELQLYPIDSEYIAFLDIPASLPINFPDVETVIILDRSGSMGDYVWSIVNEILPLFFKKLNYEDHFKIHLIAFDNRVELHNIKVADIGTLKLNARGGTNMAPAVFELHKLFTTFSSKSVKAVRILTISDGEVFDPSETKNNGDNLAEFARSCNISVNSQAIRLFTSYCQPDTTALCSLLQLNNCKKSILTDIQANSDNELIADKMADLFKDDGFGRITNICNNDAIFRKYPWDEETVNMVPIFPDENIIWLSKVPLSSVTIENQVVTVTVKDLTFEALEKFMQSKFHFAVDQMKILKVIDSENAIILMNKILNYFTRIDEILAKLAPNDQLDARSIENRIRLLKRDRLRNKTMSLLLATIVNDSDVHMLNAAQKADYLRTIDVSAKSAKGLARRSKRSKIVDVDETIRTQALEIVKNFKEIKDIDDKDHAVSFYSQMTTLEGLRTLVDLTSDPDFNSFDANQILQLINIVGVACHGPIGDYPDASSWRIDEIYYGCYVSVADIITCYHQSGNSADEGLMAPALDKEITSVVPVFDDPRIGIFLKKYAPAVLEYASSVGMRRVIAQVPMSLGYNIIAGIRRLLYDLNKNKSTVTIEIFRKCVDSAASFVGKYFGHIECLLVPQNRGTYGYYLANNGTSNLIVPLIRMYRKKTKKSSDINISDILRSIVSAEIFRAISKEFKGRHDFGKVANSMLHKLLNIDFNKRKIKSNELFIADPKIEDLDFNLDFEINDEYLTELSKPLYYLNYITLLPKFLEAIFMRNEGSSTSYIDRIKAIPEMTSTSIKQAYGVKCSYRIFIFLNIFQALKYPRTVDRIDCVASKMKFIDIKYYKEVMNDVKSYVAQQYRTQYEIDLKMKKHREEDAMAELIVSEITTSNDIQNVLNVWKNGIARNDVTYRISNSSSVGFKLLCRKLVDAKVEVPLRAELIEILLLGKLNDQVVYNNGQVCYLTHIMKYKKKFLLTRSIEEWTIIEDKFKNRGQHKYREGRANRHGYGNDDLSFYSRGYSTLEDYLKTLPLKELAKHSFKKYIKKNRSALEKVMLPKIKEK